MRYIAALAFSLVTACFAQDATKNETQPTNSAWSGNYNIDLKSRYFGPTVCGVFADQVVAQQELDVTRSSGNSAVTFTIWNSTGFHDWFQNFAYETDIDVNVAHTFGKYKVSGGGWMFLLNPKAGTHVLVADVKISRTFTNDTDTLEPFFEIQRYGVTNRDSGFHGGTYPIAGATFSHKFSRRFALVTQFHENYDMSGGFGKKIGSSMFYADAGLRITVSNSLSIILPRFGYGGSWNDAGRPKKTIWSMGLAKSF